jgi:hypothetical protein
MPEWNYTQVVNNSPDASEYILHAVTSYYSGGDAAATLLDDNAGSGLWRTSCARLERGVRSGMHCLGEFNVRTCLVMRQVLLMVETSITDGRDATRVLRTTGQLVKYICIGACMVWLHHYLFCLPAAGLLDHDPQGRCLSRSAGSVVLIA